MDIALILLVVVFIGLAAAGTEQKVKRVNRRIARLETKVDLILDHLGIDHTDPELERVRALVRQDKKIEAIKAYREITGADLVEARNAVDRMDA
ncbi:ribosomal protein L7/L12 [Streptomyces sp. NPDC006368]|uniref:ribosomal protein L7/L12 n=1 Tax=Streptomyces sp. NPDC006368 TaxID=3156760 RepID=UPI0033B53676